MQVTMPSDVETNVVNDVAATPVRCGGLIDIEQRLQNGELGGSSNWEDIENKPATFPPSTHSHDDLYYTKAETEQAITNKIPEVVPTVVEPIIEETVPEIIETVKPTLVSEVAQTVDTQIEIGGRNLFYNSGNLESSMFGQLIGATYESISDSNVPSGQALVITVTSIPSSGTIAGIYFNRYSYISRLKVGDICTVSYYAKYSKDIQAQTRAEFMGDNYTYIDLTTTWQKYIMTGEVIRISESHSGTAIALYTNLSNLAIGDKFYLSSPKVERGNKSTDWTPAIEDVDNKLNDNYYTKTETDTKLNTKANSSHTHTTSQISDFPTSIKNPNSVVIQLNSGTTEDTDYFVYDGSVAKSVNITPQSIGIFDAIYPVGSIYTSINSTDPSTLFGGTWERFGKGKVLVGVDEDDSDFSEANKTGGEKTHTLTVDEMPSHTHTQNSHTHTIGSHTHSVPAHSHGLNSHTHSFSDTSSSAGSHTHSVSGTAASAGSHTHNANFYRNNREATGHGTNTGNYRGFNDRIMVSAPAVNYDILSGGAHTHSVSGTAVSAGGHTHSVSGTTGAASGSTANSSALTSGRATPTCSSATATNNNTGGGGSHNNLQPFITVFMWVRTA